MRFIISKNYLVEALTIVSKAVTNKTPIPVLSGIKFELSEEGLTLTGSDTDLSISTFIPKEKNKDKIITIFDEGKCVLQSKYITEIIRKIDNDRIEFELVDDNFIKINDEKTNISLNGINVEEYPFIDFSLNNDVLTMKADFLKNVIQQTIFAASTKETRPILTGLNFKVDGNVLEVVATDTFRLAKKKIVLGDSGYFNVTIPSKSLLEISKIVDSNEDVVVNFFEKKVVFKFRTTTIITRVINGTYPDTDRLIPTNFEYNLETLSSEFLASIDRASLLTSDRNNIVKLQMSEEKVQVSSRSQEIGSVVENITDFTFKGSKLDISFSAAYMSDAIKSIGSEDIEILFNGDMKPFVVKNKKDETLIQLVLPVRTYQ